MSPAAAVVTATDEIRDLPALSLPGSLPMLALADNAEEIAELLVWGPPENHRLIGREEIRARIVALLKRIARNAESRV